MANIDTCYFSAAADGMLDFGATPAKPCIGATLDDYLQELVTSSETRKAPFWSVSAASPYLAMNIALLYATRQDATMWHSRCLETLSKNTPLSLRAVYQTSPRNGKGSAGTPQGNPGSSNVSLQLPLAFTPAADSPHAGNPGKRPGDDGGDNGRGKRPRSSKRAPGGSPKKKVLCPFKVKYHDNPKFENCGAYEWCHLIQHLRDRKHKPRDRCQKCGQVCDAQSARWATHISVCNEVPSRPFGRPICVEIHQLQPIAALTQRGRRSRAIEELYIGLWVILFGNDPPVPDSAFWLRITSDQATEDRGTDYRLQDGQEALEWTHRTVNNVPNLQPLQDYNESYVQIINEQTHIAQGDGSTLEEASLVDQFITHGLQNRAPTPPAPTPGGEPIPQYSEGHLEHSPSDFPLWGVSAQSPQGSLHPSQVFPPVSHQLEPGYVSPYQLDAQPFQPHVLNNSSLSAPTYPTSTEPSSGSMWPSNWNPSNLPYSLPEDRNNLHTGMMPVGSHDPVLLDENEMDVEGLLSNNFGGS